MNTKSSLIAAALLAASAGSAYAQEFVAPDAGFQSTKSRAEVIAELQQGQDRSAAAHTEYVSFEGFAGAKTRAQVQAELVAAQAAGTASTQQVDGTYRIATGQAGSKTRAEVQAELEEYKRQNPLGDTYASYRDRFGA